MKRFFFHGLKLIGEKKIKLIRELKFLQNHHLAFLTISLTIFLLSSSAREIDRPERPRPVKNASRTNVFPDKK